MIDTDIQVWDRDAPEQSLQEAHGLGGCFKQADAWVSHVTSLQHPSGVAAVQVTVSCPVWSLEFSFLGGQTNGNAHQVIPPRKKRTGR